MRVVSGPELRTLMPVADAIDALDDFLRAGSQPESPLRSVHEALGGRLLVMPAWSGDAAGVKLVTVNPANPNRGRPLIDGAYVLFDEDLAPVAVLDGATLTEIRTAAVSGLATRYLARFDARSVLVIGTGVQARAHVEAMRAVRPIDEVLVAGRRAGAVSAFVAALEVDARAAELDAVADIVCTCTTSRTPVLDNVAPGTHVNGVGSHEPDARELGDGAVATARIVVETRAAALAEAGDLLIPLSSGVIDHSQIVADLWELAEGAEVRDGDDDVTVFKSVGVAFEDLAVAMAVAARL